MPENQSADNPLIISRAVAGETEARAQTIAALKATPLRPREEVVAGICKPE